MSWASAATGPVLEIASLLDHDVELGVVVPRGRRSAALMASRARVVRVQRGAWDPRCVSEPLGGGDGLFVLGGLLVRRVAVMGRVASELVGPGDLLRPAADRGGPVSLDAAASWRALDPVRLVLLDRAWSARMSAFPEIVIALSGRAVRRSLWLAHSLAIAGHPRLDERLRLVFWELADRYGVVHSDGVHVRLPLSHDTLAELAGARRPSVSGALRRMADAGVVECMGGAGWMLHGDPPGGYGEDLAAVWPG